MRNHARGRRTAEEELAPLEHALEAALRRDEVAAEIERQARQEELADAFLHRRRRRRRHVCSSSGSSSCPGSSRRSSTLGSPSLACFTTTGAGAAATNGGDDRDPADESAAAAAAAGREAGDESLCQYTHTSPLLIPTVAWGFRVFAEACRRSKGMRRLAAAREARAGAERRVVLGEAVAAWAVEAALARGGREARRRRETETARLCLARWKVFAAFEVK